MAAPSQLLPSKLALDQLIKSYLEAAAEVPERAKMEAFEAGYFRDVVGGSQASTADLVSVASFEHLLSWVACSLDMVRPELLTLSYHLFVKSYLRMVKKDRRDESREFWRVFSPHFYHWGAEERGEQMRELAQLSSVQHDHPFLSSQAETVAREKVQATLSGTSLRALQAFLAATPSQSAVLAILNSEFSIDQVDSPRAMRGSGREEGGSLAPLSWRVPGLQAGGRRGGGVGCKRGRCWQEGEGGAEGAPDMQREPFFCSLLDHVVLPRLLLEAGAGGVEDLVRSGEQQQQVHEEEGGEELPSVLFTTFVNTHGEMSCLHLTQDAQLAVAGFSGSNSVLVWDWTRQQPHQSQPRQFNTVLPTARAEGRASAPSHVDEEAYLLPAGLSSGGVVMGQGQGRGAGGGGGGGWGRPSATLVGHSQRVCAVSAEEYSNTRRLVLSAAADESVRLWDLRAAAAGSSSSASACLARYSCADGIPWSVEFGPFGYHFLVGNQGGSAVLHCTDRLGALRVFRGHTSDVTCSGFHPNAAYVATGSDDGSVRLWDIRDASGGSVRRLGLALAGGAAGGVTALQCSPCGSLVAAGYEDGSTAVWDVPTGRLAYMLSDGSSGDGGRVKGSGRARKSVYAVQFDRSSTRLATGGQDCAVKLWDLHDDHHASSPSPSFCLLAPRATLHTKFSPVLALSGFVSTSSGAVLVAGGPSSSSSATSAASSLLSPMTQRPNSTPQLAPSQLAPPQTSSLSSTGA